MYANRKNNIRKIIFLIIANILLVFVVLLLFSLLTHPATSEWRITDMFKWIRIVKQPGEEGVIERTEDPRIIEKSDMDKREEYLSAKEQQLRLLEKELNSKQTELKAFESELSTEKQNLEQEKAQLESQKNSLSNEEDRYRVVAVALNNMDVAAAAEILSSVETSTYDAVKILLMLNKIAEEQGRYSITPLILEEMVTSAQTEATTPEEVNKKERAAKIIKWITKYDMNIDEQTAVE
jgi:flagellar motility protein MotE (MotC chaperone)